MPSALAVRVEIVNGPNTAKRVAFNTAFFAGGMRGRSVPLLTRT